MKKVTSWSAETPDGGFYAERETDTGQWWRLYRRSKFIGRKFIGRYCGFNAVCQAVGCAVMP